MRRFPDNLSESDLRTYRRWTAGLYLSYLTVIIAAIVITLALKPANDLTASNDLHFARSDSTAIPASLRSPASKP